MKGELEVYLKALKVIMADYTIDRVSVSRNMILVKITYDKFIEWFGDRTDTHKLGSEIRCELDGITYSADTSVGTLEEVKE